MWCDTYLALLSFCPLRSYEKEASKLHFRKKAKLVNFFLILVKKIKYFKNYFELLSGLSQMAYNLKNKGFRACKQQLRLPGRAIC